MARPAVQGSPVDFSAVAATTVTSGTVSSLQAEDLLLVWVGMRSASARNVTSITDTIAASGDLAWDHASDDDGGVSNNLRDAQNVQQAELWRAYVQSGDNTSGTITVNVSASTSTLYCRAVVIRATAGGTLSIDQHASADQGATDTDPGTVSITPTVESLVVAFSGNRQDQFVDFNGTLTAIGSPAEAGTTGDQMDWHAGYVDGTASTPQACTFDYAAVSEWIVQAVSVEETAAGGTGHEQPVDDSVAGTDAQTKRAGKAQADTITGADAQAKRTGKATADSLAGTDAHAKSPRKAQVDALTGTDSHARAAGKTHADTATVTDQATATTTFVRQIADSITGTDTVAKAAGRPIADSATVTDAQTKTAQHTVTDTISGADTQAKAAAHPIADPGTLTDNVSTSGSGALTHQVHEDLSVTDTVDHEWDAERTIPDTASITDSINTGGSVAHTQQIDDGLTATDALAKAVRAVRTDTASISDAVAKATARVVGDGGHLGDTANINWAAVRLIGDTVALSDHITPGGRPNRWPLTPSDQWTPGTGSHWETSEPERWPAGTATRWPPPTE